MGRDDARGEDAVSGRACADGAVVAGELLAKAEADKKCGGHLIIIIVLWEQHQPMMDHGDFCNDFLGGEGVKQKDVPSLALTNRSPSEPSELRRSFSSSASTFPIGREASNPKRVMAALWEDGHRGGTKCQHDGIMASRRTQIRTDVIQIVSMMGS